MSKKRKIDRDALYRECALQTGLVHPIEGDFIDRERGGAWVPCVVWISNAEVSELLTRERKERKKEAAERAEREAEVDGLLERILSGKR